MTVPPAAPALSSLARILFRRIRMGTRPLYRGLIAAAIGFAISLAMFVYAFSGRLLAAPLSSWLFILAYGWLVAAVAFAAVLPDRLSDSRLDRIRRWLLWSTLPAYVAPWVIAAALDPRVFTQLRSGQLSPVHVLFASWIPAFVIGINLATRLPDRLERTLQRLRDRDVLRANDGDLVTLMQHVEAIARRWSLLFGSAAAAAVLSNASEIWDLADPRRRGLVGLEISQLIFEVLASYIVGRWMGRIAAYGRLGSAIIQRKLEITVIPGHPDGAGGLKPIGTFFLHQSMIASLPAIMLALWVALFSLSPLYASLGASYRSPYVALLLAAILVEVLAFILPMRSMHAVMTTHKEEILWRKADRLSRAIATQQARVDAESSTTGQDGAPDLANLVDRYRMLENAPTWPINRTIRRRFTLRNLALVLPLVGYLVGNDEFLQQLSEVLKGM